MNNQKHSFGTYLKRIRKAKNLSMSALSKLSQVSQPYLSQIENDQKIPSINALTKLAIPLDVSLSELMYFAGLSSELQDEDISDLITRSLGAQKVNYRELNTYFELPDITLDGEVLSSKEKKEILNYVRYLLFKRSEGK
ncbi:MULTISPECIES: helix-turn-helix domain-containing protein [Paenibacillus]|uniref:Xre family transcriptional regulator n=1 Tax=Paenibacillus naphthalenovorans TaxID=162209 RepID=A0A0U2UGL2_9BACL|nr:MULTISPECIES: helix-turn-helix domain-containing protein [Paenibacillus]ALS25353.1 Xre family transcriptional regulator [Paenibacillus naphthalenovorans]MEC0214088.1 helix-turn-helix domain-containing protein [Paenibacillus ehimensis]